MRKLARAQPGYYQINDPEADDIFKISYKWCTSRTFLISNVDRGPTLQTAASKKYSENILAGW